ncbi:MAG TPA: hypothetical protein VM938_06040 [Acidimicrobiales bacterium]|nr:hypothetical protein [Acidimicrobiales bacterium]
MTRKLSVSLPDDLYEQLQAEGAENVSAFVAGAIRQQLDRQRLLGFVAELEEELGPVDEDAFATFDALLDDVLAAQGSASRVGKHARKSAKKKASAPVARSRSAAR